MRRATLLKGIIILAVALFSTLCFAALSGSLDEKHTIERIKPVGEVNVEANPAATAAPTSTTTAVANIGKKHYDELCHTCHGTGIAGAPKLGDKSDWAPRIAQGMDTLVKHALEGYKTMPPKGSCMNCSEEEIRKTVEYMVSKSK